MSGNTESGGRLFARVRLPTRRRDWRLVARTVRLVLGVPAYAGVAAVGTVAALPQFVAGQNPSLVGTLVVGGSLPLSNRLTILLELFPFVGTNYGPAAGALLVAVATATGVDVAMLAYHLREHGLSARDGTAGTAGAVIGALGAGCSACGAVLLTGLLSLVGATGLLTLLPFEGLELSVLGLAVLLLSVYWLAEGLRGGEIRGCPVDV
jgi:hypothetical protein